MNKRLENAKTLLTNRDIFLDYINYSKSRILNSGRAIRQFYGHIKLSGFTGFSEFHSCGNFVTPKELYFFQNYPLDSGEIFDVGANLGLISLILSERFPDRNIYAFEPNPSTFQNLQENLVLNSSLNVRAEPSAVGNFDGQIALNANPIHRGTVSLNLSDCQTPLLVSCTTLDTYAQHRSIQEIAFLKVDVEGYEEYVFQGAEQLLSQHKIHVIYYEVCPPIVRNAGLEPSTPTQMLLDCGYRVYQLAETSNLSPIKLANIDELTIENWIAIRP
jgi:FkbM family methyltransferase